MQNPCTCPWLLLPGHILSLTVSCIHQTRNPAMDMVTHGEVWALKLVPLSESERSPTILLLAKEDRGRGSLERIYKLNLNIQQVGWGKGHLGAKTLPWKDKEYFVDKTILKIIFLPQDPIKSIFFNLAAFITTTTILLLVG